MDDEQPTTARRARATEQVTPLPLAPTALQLASSSEQTLPVHVGNRHADPLELPNGTLLGRYEIVGRLGAGGMGIVFEARDTELDRIVALKLVRPSSRDLPAAQARLRREAQAMARLSHHNVATVFDIGSYGEHLFVAMELVRGWTLRAFVGSQHSWREQLRMLIGAGRGLTAAHEAGVTHRDFKPDNVLVRQDGLVRIADFGLAREVWDQPATPGDPDSTLVRTTGIAGTCGYMAPESFDGIADELTDQFSFAVTVFEIFEGRRPFDAEGTLDIHVRRLRQGRRLPWSRSEVPAGIRTAIDRALMADRTARWPSMAKLCAELEQQWRISRRRAPTKIAPAARRRRRIAYPLAGLAGVAGLAGLVVAGRSLLGQPAAPPETAFAAAPPAPPGDHAGAAAAPGSSAAAAAPAKLYTDVIKARNAELSRCVEHDPVRVKYSGRTVQLKINIDPAGNPAAIWFEPDELNQTAAGACIRRRLYAAVFPPAEDSRTITIPFQIPKAEHPSEPPPPEPGVPNIGDACERDPMACQR